MVSKSKSKMVGKQLASYEAYLRARRAVDDYQRNGGYSGHPKDAAMELISDLHHWCDSISAVEGKTACFAFILETAQYRYEDEKAEEDPGYEQDEDGYSYEYKVNP